MRSVPLAAVLLALVWSTAVAPVAAADACVPACTVPSTAFGFVPPVTVVESGSSLTWLSNDFQLHTATSVDDRCFHTLYSPGAPGVATLRIEDGVLYGKTPDKEEAACTHAVPLADGGFRVDYVCLFHPLMVGQLVVVPR